jgi:ABC-type transport system involved in cytochrome bd biosynthesis fused ATPase/permease subunit
VLAPGDVIGIGHALLQLDGDRLTAYVDTGENTFEADGLTVTTPKGRTLLQSVSFTLPGRSLLAVIGPSGAGKSTLLNALIGVRPADVGHVRYAERDLYEDYDELRHRISRRTTCCTPSCRSGRR